MPTATKAPPFKLFVSYSHQDEELCTRFLEHLAQLRREGFIEPWHDRKISAGRDWAGQIDDHLKAADVIVLLVSVGFLSSDYANDIEMDCAMKRSDADEARVVPVILRPCDWETSRFGKLQALPKGAMPVVDWKTSDHGFLDAVKQLRRMLVEMCQPGLGRTQLVVKAAVRGHPWRWAGIGFALVAIVACLVLWLVSLQYSQEGFELLNRGAYAKSLGPLQQAYKLNPLNRTAACGIKVAQVQDLFNNAEKYESQDIGAEFNRARQQFPNCAYMDLLEGTYQYLHGDANGALEAFSKAAEKRPELAEAHLDAGFLWKQAGQLDKAIEEYQRAVEYEPLSAIYRTTLADAYFQRAYGEDDKALQEEGYAKALQQYDLAGNYPLAAIEAGIIYRLQNNLPKAEGRELEAIQWLQTSSVRNADDKAWAQPTGPAPKDKFRLETLVEKQCYAELELAVTHSLQERDQDAADAVSSNFSKEKCESLKPDLSNILKWELYQLASATPQSATRADDFAKKFLGGPYAPGN